ncbi:MAG TPA: glycoside hydrolase family 20 zincin-like fold domain-containing protein, partial [Oligoflexia bacterium]|nr:glycoside hydrolase family 20 zincin-like fold domain-containing protein [Oligoflexia bacterium]
MKRETSKTLNIVLNKRVETCIRYFYFIALMLLLTHSAFAQTQASVVQPDSIIPRPKLITEASTSEFVHLDSRWSIYTDLASEPDVFAAQYLKDKLLEQSGGALALEVKALPKTDEIPAQAILIGNPKDDALLQQAALAEGIADIDQTLSSDKYNEGYVLAVRPASILILGRSAAGRFYGVVTLRWLAEAPLPAGSTAIPPRSLLLPNVKITDWPEMKIRGFYGGINAAVPRLNRPLDTSKLDDRLAWIDELTRYKMNFWADLIERVDPQITAGNIAFPQTASPEVGEKLIIRNFAKARYFLISVSLPPSIVAQADPNLYEGVAAEKVPFRWSPQTINGQVAYLAAPNPAMDSIVLPSLQCKGFETQEHCLDNSEWSFGA